MLASPPMMQDADAANLVTSLATVEQVLNDHTLQLGRDLVGYRNHVYRVANLCRAIAGDCRVDVEKIAVAAVFHDLGIWTNQTFDYLAPSAALAGEHLTARGLTHWIPEINAMIADHHKVTPSRAYPHPSPVAQGAPSGVEGQSLVEAFRRADWIDVTLGLRRFGLPRAFVATVAATWPNAGFHRRLVELAVDRWWKHPLNPLPMVKW